ncbi:hypothetical protein ABZ348_07215 [Streptomyces sp. NPDC005963]|uniref:SCO2583 family membrane protein n=1 Tax=Streptomyces sp. NPDC005963 TaxID=3156721 RepID=UPI0033D3485F
MAGRGDPPEGTPEGTPEGLPGGGEDEYRSVVFDESFIRAARLQEFSAHERMGEHARAVRSLPSQARRSGPKQLLILILLVAVAFGTATYFGMRPSNPVPGGKRAAPLRTTLIPLAPQGVVPGGTPGDLYANSPAAQFRIGAAGITFPSAVRTKSFSQSQVVMALTIAKDYLVESSLDPDVLTGGAVRPVRVLLDPGQLAQFDRSMATPVADGHHAATGWLVRYDPAKVVLADPEVRVRGTLAVTEAGADALEVTSDHIFAYALRPAPTHGPPTGTGPTAQLGSRTKGESEAAIVDTSRRTVDASPRRPGEASSPRASRRHQAIGRADRTAGASLFTVRRVLHFRFDRDDLHLHRAELLASYVQAGPQACSDDASGRLHPLLAGERATAGAPAGTDPYEEGEATAALCGSLASSAQPSPTP